MNLFDTLTKEDKITTENFILKYAIDPDKYSEDDDDHSPLLINRRDFVGLEKYLSEWGKNKKTLYKLLGNKLKVSIPFESIKDEKTREYDFRKLMVTEFQQDYEEYFYKTLSSLTNDWSTLRSFLQIIKLSVLIEDATPTLIKFKSPKNKKTLQIQKGAKPIRALGKVIEYFSNDEDFISSYNENHYDNKTYEDLKEGFEIYRQKHSAIVANNKFKDNLIFSIHPLDFLTMSDNSNDWSSCMSWEAAGCYRLGTVEMMNSNNVICCYMESESSRYYFGDPHNKSFDETNDFRWNSKKWRVLMVANKNIIVSLKQYPFNSEDLSKKSIELLKGLAGENLKWQYQFGPEKYLDMKIAL